jgi:hypothetical protein
VNVSRKTYLLIGTACVALVAAGLVHGYWTDRWATPVDTLRAAERLHEIPLTIGDWEGKEMKPGQAGAGVVGCIQRAYTHRQLGVSVVVALVCGRPGPVSIHTPEACYDGGGYTLGDKKGVDLEGLGFSTRFWTSDAVKTSATEQTRLRLYWAWNGGEGWVAAREGRIEFPLHRYPVLHKLYVIRDLTRPSEGPGQDEACEAFLRVFLPTLQETLFGPG